MSGETFVSLALHSTSSNTGSGLGPIALNSTLSDGLPPLVLTSSGQFGQQAALNVDNFSNIIPDSHIDGTGDINMELPQCLKRQAPLLKVLM